MVSRSPNREAPDTSARPDAAAPEPTEANLRQEVQDLRNTVATLYAREALLDAVIQSLPIWITVKDAGGRYLLVNQAMADAHGIAPGEFVGKTSQDLLNIDKSELDALDTLAHMVHASGRPVERPSYVAKTRGGTEQVRRMIKLPLHDTDGATLGVIGWSEDITDRVEVETSLDRNRRLLQALVEIMPHPVSYIDRHRKLRMVNRAWCDLMQVTREAALGRTILEIETIPLAARQALWRENDEIYSTGKPVPTTEYEGIGRDGRHRIAQVTKAPLLVGGEVDGLVALSIDVTDIRIAEQTANLAHQRLQDALNSIPAAIYLYDRDDCLVVANVMAKSMYPAAAAAMTPGTPFARLVGEIAKTIYPDTEERVKFVERRIQEFRHIVRQVEQRGPGGEYLIGQDRRTTEGGTVSIRFDITDQKRIQQELERRERQTRTELTLAAEVQRHILQEVKPPSFITEAHVFRPSTFVSGDVYHAGSAPDGSFLFFIGDATGHGVSAALVTMLVEATLTSMPGDIPLEHMAEQLNTRLVAYRLEGMYVSGIFLRISPSGLLTYANAGHPSALVVGPGDIRELASGGPPMGWFEGPGYESGALQLTPGSKLILLTDGLTEWAGANGKEFGAAGVSGIARQCAGDSPQVILGTLMDAVTRHSDGQPCADDLTLFVMEYQPDLVELP